MKKILFLSTSLGVMFLVAYNNGPLPENTAAPGEMTCYRSSCHVNNGSGNAQVYLRTISGVPTYQPYDTLDLEFGFSTTPANEHGFQMVALDTNNQNVGKWILNNSNLYKQISGFSYPSRKYLEHTLAGTARKNWQVKWFNNGSYSGEIRFYASLLQSNEDDTKQGDTLYTINHAVTNVQNTRTDDLKRRVPVFKSFIENNKLFFLNTGAEPLRISLITLKGHLFAEFNSIPSTKDEVHLSTGVYILVVQSLRTGEISSSKLIAF